MDPLWILFVGIIIVVGGILVLKLHAFVALVLGAIAVAALTPSSEIDRAELKKSFSRIVSVDIRTKIVNLDISKSKGVKEGHILIVFRDPSSFQEPLAKILVFEAKSKDKTAKARLVGNTKMDVIGKGNLAIQRSTVGERVAFGFGNTCGKIGILIAMASIIGKCLLESGAADRIVRSTLGVFGEARAALAFMFSGFLLGIPVFFDTVFYLMIPLGKAMRLRTGKNYLLYVLAIVAGATMAHSLVPPTPGPLFVASELGVNLGTMILAGCLVGIFTSSCGYFYALWANRRWDIPVRGSAEFSLKDLENLSQRDESQLPPTWLSLLPIVLPVVLIAGGTVMGNLATSMEPTDQQSSLLVVVQTLGNKNIALVIAAAIALGTLAWQKRASREELATAVQASLSSAGIIILITAAGGAFGGVLQQTGIGGRIEEISRVYHIDPLLLAFGVTALVRTAQGSATVAMMTAVGIVGGLASDPVALGFDPVYMALAIGCGSKPIPWMNDSGFWVICKMSGMTETETLKIHSPMATAMGFVGLAVTVIGSRIFPMI